MQINDDTIRSAFAWPVRYDEEAAQVEEAHDANDPRE
jgi:hypothetical protein